MLYAVLCYSQEATVASWTKAKEEDLMHRLQVVQEKLVADGQLGPHGRLMPTTAATTIRIGRELAVVDGPFAETKEQFLGFYLFDCETFEEVLEAAKQLARERESGALEIRPLLHYTPGRTLA
ncbi:MAG TPA: YciI family protein [Myxococcota bacterium]|nr:YciI family protein [Myxococcota bacterium]